MNKQLEELSIEQLFSNDNKSVYEIPIYQRNYAWEKDEISALIQDIWDAYGKRKKLNEQDRPYYIGTLVSYHKGDSVFEIIDGQQRLTTIELILSACGFNPGNHLKYKARKKADRTLKQIRESVQHRSVHTSIYDTEDDEKDTGIENGFQYAKSAILEYIGKEKDVFLRYFLSHVHIIHYRVPKDIDLNHYFEIMNSRGEQLEKHEIVKANLMQALATDEERKLFNYIWECCSDMSVYTQQNLDGLPDEAVFGNALTDFLPESFTALLEIFRKRSKSDQENRQKNYSIEEILSIGLENQTIQNWEEERKDSFQPIINFPNFLLIVLKISRMREAGFDPKAFNLDDKELLNEFYEAKMDSEKVKEFAYYLLKARFYLDNYIVHHANEEDTMDSNPWKLQVRYRSEAKKGKDREQLRNLCGDDKNLQDNLTQLLSMFEVSFTARQRKNYLFYCLLYLLGVGQKHVELSAYKDFVEGLAARYFHEVYLDKNKLNEVNTPLPGSFDEVILENRKLSTSQINMGDRRLFDEVFGDGKEASAGIPLFVFNYLDFLLWKRYATELRGEKANADSKERKDFFEKLGCTDFGREIFDQFYFSRTRRSLEHFFPQANVGKLDDAPNKDQINCFGNYAMIGAEANSSGSNWSPETKLTHYLNDRSGKIDKVSVASLKFMIMMQICKEKQQWKTPEIMGHHKKMADLFWDD